MIKKSEAAHGGQPCTAPKNETRQVQITTPTPDSQGSTAYRLQRIAEALDRYLRQQRGGHR